MFIFSSKCIDLTFMEVMTLQNVPMNYQLPSFQGNQSEVSALHNTPELPIGLGLLAAGVLASEYHSWIFLSVLAF